MTKAAIVDLLRADFDFVTACEIADEIMAEVRESATGEIRYNAPSVSFTLRVAR